MNSEVKISDRVDMPQEARKSEPPEDGYSDFLKQDEWYGTDIKPYVLDHADEYERPDFMFIKDGKPFAPLGSICSITGQPGHGKTTTFSIFMTAILKGECCGIRYNLYDKYPKPKILYIDTEMEKGNTQKVIRRIYKMCGMLKEQRDALSDRLYVLRLREVDDVQERWKIVMEAIYEIRPQAVFLDGFLDMVSDFNDNKECLSTIYKHMSVSTKFDCVLWDLVHQNPNSDKMVGHGGSFIQRKGADIFQVKKIKESGFIYFEVTHVKARGQDQEDWRYKMVDDEDYVGTPILYGLNTSEELKEQEVMENMAKIFYYIFSNENIDQYTTRDFEDAISNAVKYCGLETGKNSPYTKDKVKEYLVEKQWVVKANGNNGAKLFVKHAK